MAKRPTHRRAQDFKPGSVLGWPAGANYRDLAARARYCPDGKHKGYPAPNGEWTFNPSSDGTRCPTIPVERWAELEAHLREALYQGVVGGELRGSFPARAWVYLGSTLCEARLSNQETGEYHGFPLDYEEHHPSDPDGLLTRAPRMSL